MVKQAGKNDDFVAFLCEEGLARFCVEEYEEVNPYDWKFKKQRERRGKVYTSGQKNENSPNLGTISPKRQNRFGSKKKNINAQNKHLTNYSISKTSSKFVYTEELTEINQGTKRTLTSYWKSLEKEGHNVDKAKKKIKKCCQHLVKSIEPYLKYFMRCTFPRDEYSQEPSCFHILGVDILLDSKLNPWILEINANPSMNIESQVAKRETDDSVSLIDLHVKSM